MLAREVLGFNGARLVDNASMIAANGAKVLSRSAYILAAASAGYDFATGHANTSTIVNAGVTVAGVVAVAALGLSAAPAVAVLGITYCIIEVAGCGDWLNINFDISDKINFVKPK